MYSAAPPFAALAVASRLRGRELCTPTRNPAQGRQAVFEADLSLSPGTPAWGASLSLPPYPQAAGNGMPPVPPHAYSELLMLLRVTESCSIPYVSGVYRSAFRLGVLQNKAVHRADEQRMSSSRRAPRASNPAPAW